MGNTNEKEGGGGGLGMFQVSRNVSSGINNSSLDMIPYEDDLEEFEEKRILDWSEDDVMSWLKSIGFEGIAEEVKGKNITKGSDLVENLRYEDEECLTVLPSKSDERKIFFTYIQHLRNCTKRSSDYNGSQKIPKREEEKFNLNFHRVFRKVCKCLFETEENVILDQVKKRRKNYRINDIAEHCAILSDRKKIEKFLLTDEHISQIESVQEEKPLKVLFFISEPVFNPRSRLESRKLSSKMTTEVPIFPSENMTFSSSLVFGDYHLCWNESALIIPKYVPENDKDEHWIRFVNCDTNCVMSEENENVKYEDVKSTIARIIEDWNCNKRYSPKPSNSVTEGSCLHFVLEVCKETNVDLKFIKGGCFTDHLVSMKKFGCSDVKLTFRPSPEFTETFKILEYSGKRISDVSRNIIISEEGEKEEEEEDVTKQIEISFDTHQELDDFLSYCFERDRETFRKNQDDDSMLTEEFRVLKTLDRAFWLRHMTFRNREEYKPERESIEKGRSFGKLEAFKCGCPFGDPRDKNFNN